jgi:hypothetical protein
VTKTLRPIKMIEAELADAQVMAANTSSLSRDDPFVAIMLEVNDRDIEKLSTELAEARSSDVELSIEGSPVVDHRISVSYLNRVTGSLQSAYKAFVRKLVPKGQSLGAQGGLALAGTGPGSFRMRFITNEEPLSLLERPLSERALGELFELLASSNGPDMAVAEQWAARAPAETVRAMIRLASSLAASKGTSQLRWTTLDGNDRVVQIAPDRASRLAAALVGRTGTETIKVRGHLAMAQDEPPKIKVTTATDEHVAAVRDDDLLDAVKELLFDNVIAEILVEMSTSGRTGAPSSRSTLLDIRADDGDEQPQQTSD